MTAKKLNLYLLKTDNYDYEECDGFVVRAENEESARLLANAMDKRYDDTWLDTTGSTCVLITGEGEQRIVLYSFNAG